MHEGRPAGSENTTWLGVEWDDASRGRHNGTVEKHKYFETKDNLNSGTLIKWQKAELGSNILDGILTKYFKDSIPPDLKKKIEE